MTVADIELIRQIANGSISGTAIIGLIVLVVYVLRQDERREERYAKQIEENTTRFITALAENTQALEHLSTQLEQKLDAMSERIRERRPV